MNHIEQSSSINRIIEENELVTEITKNLSILEEEITDTWFVLDAKEISSYTELFTSLQSLISDLLYTNHQHLIDSEWKSIPNFESKWHYSVNWFTISRENKSMNIEGKSYSIILEEKSSSKIILFTSNNESKNTTSQKNNQDSNTIRIVLKDDESKSFINNVSISKNDTTILSKEDLKKIIETHKKYWQQAIPQIKKLSISLKSKEST